MSWQGIPYPSFASNTLDAGLTVTKIPEIIVDTGIGWGTIIGAILAALIGAALPAAVTFYTIKKNDNKAAFERANQLADLSQARATQLRLAEISFNAQVLSTNRQEWINNLRDNIAKFISLLGVEISIRNLFNAQRQSSRNDGNIIDTYQNSLESKQKISQLSIEIELMLNPAELTSKAILQCIRELRNMINNEVPLMLSTEGSVVNIEYKNKTRSLIRVTQRCLKNEWKRVKAGI